MRNGKRKGREKGVVKVKGAFARWMAAKTHLRVRGILNSLFTEGTAMSLDNDLDCIYLHLSTEKYGHTSNTILCTVYMLQQNSGVESLRDNIYLNVLKEQKDGTYHFLNVFSNPYIDLTDPKIISAFISKEDILAYGINGELSPYKHKISEISLSDFVRTIGTEDVVDFFKGLERGARRPENHAPELKS